VKSRYRSFFYTKIKAAATKMHGKGCPVMEHTIRRTAIERPHEALSELRLPPNKNREKQARADEKRGFAGDISTSL
jgi:hypothetical protein